MSKKAVALILLALNVIVAYSQEPCITDFYHQNRLSDPNYAAQRAFAESTIQQILNDSQPDGMASPSPNEEEVYEIPIVYHIIHKGEPVGTGTNISDEQILSSLDALNRDFRRTADDNGIALGAGVDTKIQFCLAKRDPQGRPHSGINRVDGTVLPGYDETGITMGDDYKVKELSHWDPRYYVNIWVVSEIMDNNGDVTDPASFAGGVLGFATLPTIPTADNITDGIVVVNLCLGNDPFRTSDYRLWYWTVTNRALTHEMGHYLGLYHPFEGQSCNETDCMNQGDRVCDTPPTVQATNCNSPACNGTQQVENYMGYTNEFCRDMFTAGQTERMRATLEGIRHKLLTTNNCLAPNRVDASISAINTPVDHVCQTTFVPEVVLTNFGSDPLTSVIINYGVNGGNMYSYNWTGNLPIGSSEVVTIPAITAEGAQSFRAYTSAPNWQTDQDPSNDVISSSFNAFDGHTIKLTLVTDQKGNEVVWGIYDKEGTDYFAHEGPYDYLDNTGTATYTHYICVPEGCHLFDIYDFGEDGICCDYGDGYYLLENAFGEVLASGGPSFGIRGELTEFCVEGMTPPSVDFRANVTTIMAGETVHFNDLSDGRPSPDAWAWTFDGGTPSTSTLQNPSIRYHTPGVYPVTLAADNGAFDGTATKVDYIHVIAPGGNGNCDTLRNYKLRETLTHYDDDNTWGYIPGHNGFGWTAYAEPFRVRNSISVQRLQVDIAVASFSTPASVVNWHVYDDDGGRPGAILATVSTPISTYTPGETHIIDFIDPVDVDRAFWVGMALTYAPGDTVAITTAEYRGLNGRSTTMIQTNGNWEHLSDQFPGLTTSLGIDVMLSDGVTKPHIVQSATHLCEGTDLEVDMQFSTSTSSHLWLFPGGTPSYSYNNPDPTEVIAYDTPGTYDIKLYTEGGCYVDSAFSQITVGYPTINAIDVMHVNGGLNNGSITINVSSGTPPYQYSIDGGINFYNSGIFGFLAPGTYQAVVKDANDCEAYSTAWIYQTSAANNGGMNMANGVNTTTATPIPGSSTSLSDAIQLYPNPSNGMVHLNINLEQEQDVKITVLNAIGEVMQTMESKATTINTFTFDLSNEAKGIYFFNIQTNDNTITKRLTLSK